MFIYDTFKLIFKTKSKLQFFGGLLTVVDNKDNLQGFIKMHPLNEIEWKQSLQNA